MLDTVRLGIPVSPQQHKKILATAYSSDREQWGLFVPTTGELVMRRITGLAETSQSSFHRDIKWDIPATYRDIGTYLIVELSLPKLYYGHNIHLLYDFTKALNLLKQLLEKRFSFSGRGKLVDIGQWQLWRLDCCYAWRMPSQEIAQQVLDSLKHLNYPRKKPVIYPTTILFVGNTYSLKFYLKLPEFKNHDLKALQKAKASLGWINHLEEKASGVLRCEATLRRNYLERSDIKTVADLVRPLIQLEPDQELISNTEDIDSAIEEVLSYTLMRSDIDTEQEFFEYTEDGNYISMPKGCELYSTNTLTNKINCYKHAGGGFTVRKRDNPTAILQYFVDKFVGDYGMQLADEVEAKLRAFYQTRKAGRLLGTWLCVQRLGVDKTKELFGKDAYYRDYRDMKKAGVSLIEASQSVVTLNPNFFKNFKMKIPSEHVTNKFDDFPNTDNILNYIPKPNS